MQLIETLLGRLGSRLTLHFLPKARMVRLGALGKFYDHAWHLKLGFQVGGEVRLLPLAGPDVSIFPEIEMELTASSVKFRAQDRTLGLAATFTFTAPFYPQAEKLCLAPFFYLDVSLDRLPANSMAQLVAELVMLDDGATSCYDLMGLPDLQAEALEVKHAQIRNHWGPRTKPDSLSDQTFTAPLLFGLYNSAEQAAVKMTDKAIQLSAQANKPTEFNLLLATYLAGPVLEVKSVRHSFKYTRWFKDLAAVCQYAITNARAIKAQTAAFDKLLQKTSLGKTGHDLIAFALQNYIINTWWTIPLDSAADHPAAEWYSVWEGNCAFHSTVDVEYNLAWFYLLLWPQLLEKTIAQWRNYLQTDERGTWLSHDIGGVLEANQQTYPHQMEVEESCNFVLLVYALWRSTGREQVRQDNLAVVKLLMQFVLDSDTTGNGLPNRGTANTIDDASAAVQFGKEQIYLAIKALSAGWATAALLKDDHDEAKIYRDHAHQINTLLQQQAWLGDHYAVTLDRTTDGLIDPWTHAPLPPGELGGWDAYSLYTGNGLLYLLSSDSGDGSDLPPFDWARLRQDVQNALEQSRLEYGCTHSSSDKSNIWISQNLHRDMLAAYLGLDFSGLLENYWAFELFENGEYGRGGGFVDTYGHNWLHFYPRGITALGLLHALAGIRLNRSDKKLWLQPARVPLRVPLLMLADWQATRVPWVEFYLENGQVKYKLEQADALNDWDVRLD